jgi:hypothetical protein
MGTRRLLVLATLFATGAMFAGTTTASAGQTTPSPDPGTVQTNDARITVSISGTGYTPQHGGSTGSGGGSDTVRVLPPCWLFPAVSGKAGYEFALAHPPAPGTPYPPMSEFVAHKDDVTGYWYGVACSNLNWPDPNDWQAFGDFSDAFEASHPIMEFYPAGQSPPDPPVPPGLLREVAIKNMTVPDPKLNWNPRRKENQGTLVNLQTWFWLENPPPNTLTVRAAAGGNWATVTVTFDGMKITAPGEEAVSCAGTGIPYAPGAHDPTCALMFSRASSALGTDATAVTVNTSWTGTWVSNGTDMGPITPQPTPGSDTENIVVDEVQTLVTGAR